jgi:hypothetical protein
MASKDTQRRLIKRQKNSMLCKQSYNMFISIPNMPSICGCFIFPLDTLLGCDKLIKNIIITAQQAQQYDQPQHPSVNITMKLVLLLPLLSMVFETSHAKDAVVRGNGGHLLDLQEELSMSMSMSMLGDLSLIT